MNRPEPQFAPDRGPPSRVIHVGDGVTWLSESELSDAHAIVTSLPDVSETPELGFDGWKRWFVDTVELACAKTAERGVAMFYQTDIKRDGRWVDKGFLVSLGAERAGLSCLFHKIVCRLPAGTTTFGRPAYAHLLAFSRALVVPPGDATRDVVPELGEMSWSRAMGTKACEAACAFLLRSTHCSVVVDPFCGLGSVLAVANAFGLDAIGVELSQKRVRKARRLTFSVVGGLR